MRARTTSRRSAAKFNRFLPFIFLALFAGVFALSNRLVGQDAAATTEATVSSTNGEAAPAPEATAEATVPPTPEERIAALEESTAAHAIDSNILWMCITAYLVFFMQAGFAMVETGFTRAKNTANILMKNLIDFAAASIAFWLIGYGLMFGAGPTGSMHGWFGTTDFAYDPGIAERYGFLIFQTVFAGTAATIVSGAMAERTKFQAYLLYSVAITVIVYPIYGHWAWGSAGGPNSVGWLQVGPLGFPAFIDFAGSTVVHSIGGWAALAGTIALGPRIGKYVKGRVMAIPGHNLTVAALGVFILWFGWFGFNPGSTLVIGGGGFAKISMTTNLSAAAGMLGGIVASWWMFKKPDPSFAMNGTLAGLVGITAGCAEVSMLGAVIIGGVAGVLVVFSCLLFENLGIDDPVGAVSVHGVCGAWGTFAVGLFSLNYGLFYGHGTGQLVTQIIGILAAFIWSFGLSWLIFNVIKKQVGLRVSEQEETAGLDVHEHGMLAYPPHWIVDPTPK